MVLFKACPRCHGDMHENRDIYGDYKECLNCGYMQDIENPEAQKVLRRAAMIGSRKRKKKVA